MTEDTVDRIDPVTGVKVGTESTSTVEESRPPKWARTLLEFEESMSGKPSARWAKTNGLELTGLAILLSLVMALFGSGPVPNGLFEMASIAMEGGEVNGRFLPQASASYSYLYATITAIFLFLALSLIHI